MSNRINESFGCEDERNREESFFESGRRRRNRFFPVRTRLNQRDFCRAVRRCERREEESSSSFESSSSSRLKCRCRCRRHRRNR